MAEQNDIQLRSEKVRNIIGNIPPLLIRSGISFIVALVSALFVAAWFIPYPESLKVPLAIAPPTDSTGTTEFASDPSWKATAWIPYTYISRITEGMPVQIEFDGYPSTSYGYAHGSVTHIDKSILKQNSQNYFTITVTLSTPQSTTNNISLQDDMNAQAFIFLSNESILKHILKGLL